MNAPETTSHRPENERLDLLVPTTKTAAMRYLAELAGYGYCLFQQGEIAAEKAVSLLTKFEQRYRVLATRGVRDYARARRVSCARLVMFPGDAGATWLFWLLATQGAGEFPSQPSTCDARNPETRLRWGEQYELVACPVRRRPTSKGSLGELRYIWTWALTAKCSEGWRERLATAAGRARSSAEHRSDYLAQQIDLLRKVPGFHGINRQKRALVLAANVPRQLYEELELRFLGTIVDKSLAVFEPTRTLRSVIESFETETEAGQEVEAQS